MGNTKTIALLLLLVLITSSAYTQHNTNTVLPGGHDQVLWVGSKEWLLSLRRGAAPVPGLLDDVPEELL